MSSSIWNDNKYLKNWVKKHQKNFFDNNFNFNMMDLLSDPLLETVSNKLNIKKEYIYMGVGSSQFIPAIISLRNWQKIYLVSPEFGLYKRSLNVYDSKYQELVCIKFDELIKKLVKIRSNENDLLIISSPRWFSGERLTPSQLSQILCIYNGKILIDEAYISFSSNEEGLIKLALKNSRVIVLRSFSEKYFLPGLRVGYMVTKINFGDFRKTLIPPHSINTYTQRFCIEMINDEKLVNFLNKLVIYVKTNRDLLYENIKNNKSIEVIKSESNFITVIIKNKKYLDYLQKNLSNIPGVQFFSIDKLDFIKIWVAGKDFSSKIINVFQKEEE